MNPGAAVLKDNRRGNLSECKYLCVQMNRWFCGYGILDGKKYPPLANVKITDIPVDPYHCQPEKCDYYIQKGEIMCEDKPNPCKHADYCYGDCSDCDGQDSINTARHILTPIPRRP